MINSTTLPRRCGPLGLVVLLVCVLFVASAAIADAQDGPPVAPNQETKTLKATQDTFVSNTLPDNNFGTNGLLYVGQAGEFGATRTLVGFDLKELDKKYVVVGGELRMYLRAAGQIGEPARDVVLYRVQDSWNESVATWSNFPKYEDERIASASVGLGGGWQTWSIDKLARDWYTEAHKNRGLYVQGYEADSSFRSFDSREAANEPELKLKVEIDAVAPMASLEPLPPYYASSSIPLAWQPAHDPEPSSLIDFYEVWYQRENGQWLLAATNIRDLVYTFNGAESGYVYGFQVLAVDRAGNAQLRADVAQATTLVDFTSAVAQLEPLPQWATGSVTLRASGYDLPAAPLKHSGLSHFDMDVRIDGGAWEPVAYSWPIDTPWRYDNPPDGVFAEFRARAVDKAGNIPGFGEAGASTTIDWTAPRSWFIPQSGAGVDARQFRVQWEGSDSTSGVATFDVQYQVDGGPWQQWQTGTTMRADTFTGDFGKTYGFRILATDNAGNKGAYSARAQLLVTVVDTIKLSERVYMPVNNLRGQ